MNITKTNLHVNRLQGLNWVELEILNRVRACIMVERALTWERKLNPQPCRWFNSLLTESTFINNEITYDEIIIILCFLSKI